jgi:hypothetical protein
MGKFYLDPLYGMSNWRYLDSVTSVVARGWDAWVGLPFYYFLALRWVWRFFLWSLFLIRLSLAKPELQAHHPDQTGGLAFLVYRHLRFLVVALALSTVISAKVCESVLDGRMELDQFYLPIGLYLAVVNSLIFGPLLIFTPLLIKVRRRGVERYGSFANRYAKLFDEKWIAPEKVEALDPLGTPDLQSLNDLDGSYAHQREMGSTLMKRQHILAATMVMALPFAPLILLKIPLREVITLALRTIA